MAGTGACRYPNVDFLVSLDYSALSNIGAFPPPAFASGNNLPAQFPRGFIDWSKEPKPFSDLRVG